MNQLTMDLMAWSLRHFPFEAGRWRFIPYALKRAEELPPDAIRDVKTRDGFRMRVRVSDWLGRHVYVRGEYEPDTAQVFKALLSPGDCFVDVGANAGYFTLLASKRVGAKGKVLAFEPVPVTRKELLTNLGLNYTTNVTVFEQALSNAAGHTSFSVGPENHRGTSSLRALNNGSETLTVETARLDDLLPKDQRVSLIKIDVEGAEQLALEGMTACLQRDHPDLVIEVTDEYLKPMGHSAASLCGLLGSLGYRMYAIEQNALTPITIEQAAKVPQYNALFTVRQTLPAQLTIAERPRVESELCVSSI